MDTGGRGGGYGGGGYNDGSGGRGGGRGTPGGDEVNPGGGAVTGGVSDTPPGEPPKPGMVWDPKRGWITPTEAPSWQNHWGQSPGEGRRWINPNSMGTVGPSPYTAAEYAAQRGAATGLAVPPAGGNPWANYANSALAGMGGGLANATNKWGYQNTQMPSLWQGMTPQNTSMYSQNRRNMDHIGTYGQNKWMPGNTIWADQKR